MPSRSIGNANAAPWNATRQQVTMETEIPVGGYLYMDSGILTNLRDGTDLFAIDNAAGYAILSGDLSSLRTQLIEQFKTREPNSTIEVSYMKVSWESAIIASYAPYGYLIKGFRIEALIKNIQAGLAPLVIAAIIIGLSILIPVVVLAATIAWIAYSIISAAQDLGSPVVIAVGLVVMVVLVGAMLLLVGVRFKGKHGKTSISAGKAN